MLPYIERVLNVLS